MRTQRNPGGRRSEVRGSAPTASAAVSRSTVGLGDVLVFVILGVLLVRENGALLVGGARQSPLETQGAELSPAGTESPGPSTTPSFVPEASPTSAPTTAPEASLTGEVPGPDATVPPGVPVIPGLRIEALAGHWQSIGLTCESWSGGSPGGGGGYTLHCARSDESANVEYNAEAIYWTSDGVHWVSLSIDSISDEAIDGVTAAAQLFLPSAELAGGAAARAWVEDRIGDTTCRGDCNQVIGGSQLALTVGHLGGHFLYVVAVPQP